MDELLHMKRALKLAERGRGRVRPNPVVGAVVVRDGRVVGEGWHRGIGLAHAEAMALAAAGAKARGATLFVTLEPCDHTGRTAPCADAIVRAGVRRCVVAVRDPHPIVNGRGLRRLRAAGVRVELGLCQAEARAILGGYWSLHTAGRPRVTLKLAASLDGRIAPARGFAASGPGRWLTGPAARRAAHRLRAQSDAVVIGAGTARADDPRLTVRGVRGATSPLRVVCDGRLALPRSLRLLRAPLARGTVVVCTANAPAAAERALTSTGVDVWRLARAGSGVSPLALLQRLGREGIHEVLVEGGARLATSFLEAGLVDRLALFIAPTLLGDAALPLCRPLSKPRRGRIARLERVGSDGFAMVELEG